MSSLPSNSAFSRLADSLQCDLCTEPFNLTDRIPRLIHAGHTYCTGCITTMIDNAKRQNVPLKCPSCRARIPIPIPNPTAQNQSAVLLFTPNYRLLDVIQIIAEEKQLEEKSLSSGSNSSPLKCSLCDPEDADIAVKFCRQCVTVMCEIHSTAHRKDRQTKSHEIQSDIPPSEMRLSQKVSTKMEQKQTMGIMCDIHPQFPSKYFCTKCSQSICVECTIITHRDHPIEAVSTYILKLKEKLQGESKQLVDSSSSLQDMIEKIQSQSDIMVLSQTAEEKSLHEFTRKLHDIIEQKKSELLTELKSSSQQRFKEMSSVKEMLDFNKAQCQSLKEAIDKQIEGPDDERFLEVFQQLDRDLQRTIAATKEEVSLSSVESQLQKWKISQTFTYSTQTERVLARLAVLSNSQDAQIPNDVSTLRDQQAEYRFGPLPNGEYWIHLVKWEGYNACPTGGFGNTTFMTEIAIGISNLGRLGRACKSNNSSWPNEILDPPADQKAFSFELCKFIKGFIQNPINMFGLSGMHVNTGGHLNIHALRSLAQSM